MKPKILLYMDSYGDKVSVNEAYVNYLSRFGEPILVMSANDLPEFVEKADVLALPGGADVDPMRYNEYPKIQTRTNPHFEYLDKYLLKPWIETGKPIIGICRGLQTLNVAMGGSLYQDIRGHVQAEPRDACPQKMYTDIPGYEITHVNSFHHQAIKRLADGFDVLGWTCVQRRCPSLNSKELPVARHVYEHEGKHSKKPVKVMEHLPGRKPEPELYYSFPEIIKHRELPYIAFQYHPEEFSCPLATKLICETLNLVYEPAQDAVK